MPSSKTSTGLHLPLDDLFELAGTEKIGQFAWCDRVCEEVNVYFSSGRKLTADHTGIEGIALMKSLPFAAFSILITLRFDPRTGEAYRGGSDGVTAPVVTPVLPTDGQVDGGKKEPSLHGKIMLMIATTMVIIALVLTFKTTNGGTDGELKSSTLEIALTMLAEIFKSTASNDPGSDTSDEPSRRQPRDEPRNTRPQHGPSYD